MVKKMKALIIANKTVFPATDGGSIAMQKLATTFSHLNYNIDIITEIKQGEEIEVEIPINCNFIIHTLTSNISCLSD